MRCLIVDLQETSAQHAVKKETKAQLPESSLKYKRATF